MTLFHQLHEEDGSAVDRVLHYPQELHDAGMLQVSQDAALLVEASGMQDFGGAGKMVQRGSDDAAVGACPAPPLPVPRPHPQNTLIVYVYQ